MTLRQLEARINAWATNEVRLAALVTIGSLARGEPDADEWSDLDLVLFVRDPGYFLGDGSWLDAFGPVWLRALQWTGSDYPEWFVLYEGGFKVDLLLAPAGLSPAEARGSSPFDVVARRGWRILVDKGTGDAKPGNPLAAHRTSADQPFETAVSLFWITAFRAACLLCRGDLWRARQIMDVTLRRQLIELLARKAQIDSDRAVDTWYDGRYVLEWADPRAAELLPRLFAPFEQEASEKALLTLQQIYQAVAEDVAARSGCTFPRLSVDHVRDWIQKALNGPQ